MRLPTDHPLRYVLNNEVHARPPKEIVAPEQISYFALMYGADVPSRAKADLARLCEITGVQPPPAESSHFHAQMGTIELKWELHTEFVSYTFSRRTPFDAPFSKPTMQQIPEQWLESVGGQLLVGVHLAVREDSFRVPDLREIVPQFSGNHLVGAKVGGGNAIVLTDFRIHEDGFSRMLLMDTGMGKRQGGRLAQRLLELETYRMASLLALPVAREIAGTVTAAEADLASMTTALSHIATADEPALLKRITALAANVENQLATTNFRFGAARAYYSLVKRRIAELREERLEGVQTIDEFLERRLAPAMNTCESAAQRLFNLSERIARTSALLRSRVDIEREQQNQALLASMDRRARLQLRLQQTVEGLSVAAITYYVTGLVGYAAKGLHALGVPVNAEIAVAVAIPIVAASVWYGMQRWRKKLAISD
ncbi:MAG TPA: DUF3422 domain-containing protein [Usitatibacteraceae bacterium]